jgi:ADP-dependent NAD(P)H-hydrate dehydratase / NAD(P)H-hydrate epimerase
MKIVTAAEMREIDRVTTHKYGIPSLTLMENAGAAVARFALEQYREAKRITLVCGKGNNGGDGLVAARRLHEDGRDVRVVLLAAPNDVKGDALENLKRLPLSPVVVDSTAKLSQSSGLFCETDLLIDAIFGTGFRPPLPELSSKAIELIAKSEVPVISVDVPSGADADSFQLDQPDCCRSSAIVTFTALKPGIIFSALTRGPIVVANIGSPDEAITSKLGLQCNDIPKIVLQLRNLNSNKGLYGHALIIGGSLGKSGAPTMAAAAALRVGAGLVTCAAPRSVLPIIASSIAELMTEPLEENAAGAISERALDEAEAALLLRRKNVVAVGPGLGRDAETVAAVRAFIARCSLPLVLDADALNAFEDQSRLLDGNGRQLVLTPHPGEMARLVGTSVQEVEAHRIEVARRFAGERQLVLVLKGWRTLIADGQGNIWVNTTGNPGLAKGGSGDALTGIVTGLIAQHPERIVEAVRAGVYLHGLAADMALATQSEETMLTSDVIAALASAFRVARKPRNEFTWVQRGAARQ